MWRINVLSVGNGRTGSRTLADPSNKAQSVKSAASTMETLPGDPAMNTIYGKPDSELCSARTAVRPVNFYCRAPQARSVQLAGDFNHWSPLPMEPRDNG